MQLQMRAGTLRWGCCAPLTCSRVQRQEPHFSHRVSFGLAMRLREALVPSFLFWRQKELVKVRHMEAAMPTRCV